MGTVVISIDAALGWRAEDSTDVPERVEDAREGWRELVSLLETFDLPATWAVAGHLLLAECGGEHPSHPLAPEAFEREREAWADRPDLRFADGLVAAVQSSDPDHDVGCCSFSYVDFGHPETTARVARAELAASHRAAARRGIDLSSFVFPYNSVGHRGELAAAGLDCYRGVVPSTVAPSRKILDATVGTPSPRLVTPAVDDWGLVNLPASLDLFSFGGIARTVLEPAFGDPVVAHVERGVDAVAGTDRVFHLWLRPSSVARERDRERLRQVFRRIDRRPDEVDVATMATVAEGVEADRPRTQVGELS